MNTKGIKDQSTDTDFTTMHKVLQKVANDDLYEALHHITIDYDHMTKLSTDRFADQENCLFPVDTAENTILSKLYFDHQRDQMTEKTASAISSRITAFLDIHGLPEEIFKYKPTEKMASTSACFVLLPEQDMCKVASEEDLHVAGKLFAKEFTNLTVPERVVFSQNFIKAAAHFQISEYPTEVAKYASQLDTDLSNTKFLLEARALLAARTGQDGQEYTKLAQELDTLTEEPKVQELEKLAEVIHTLDVSKGFDAPKYDKHIPCAYSSVFNKVAEESVRDEDKDEEDLKKMDKAAIISKYGDGVLEQVEDEDGNIDIEKLKEVAKMKKAFQPEVQVKDI